MMLLLRLLRFMSACAVALVLSSNIACAIDWIAPTAEELTVTSSRIDPDAGAEVLYRLKQIDNGSRSQSTTDGYIRIKIFNEKGVRQLDKISIEYTAMETLIGLQARVIKPNGQIINVDRSAFYSRDLKKSGTGRVNLRATSFSFPMLEPGDIAEYKWCLRYKYDLVADRFFFLMDFPTRLSVFRLRPARLDDQYKTMAFFYKCENQRTTLARDGFYFIEMHNQPAFESEPDMEPAQDAQPWMVFYPVRLGETPQQYWVRTGREIGDDVERYVRKGGKIVSETAAGIVAGATDVKERLDRINDYCRTNIVNIDYFTPPGGVDEKIRKEPERPAADLIKTKLGNSNDIPILFIALARSQGIDARLALCASRNDGAFRMNLPQSVFLNERIIAVKINGEWCFYDPAHMMVDAGKLHWQFEGVQAMIAHPKYVEWVETPKTSAADSTVTRTADFQLDEEGTLSGDVSIEYTGQSLFSARGYFYEQTEQRHEEAVREIVQARIPIAEVRNVTVRNSTDVLKPLVLTYSVKIRDYAERTGQRHFIQPNFFTKGKPVRYIADKRINKLFFDYGETIRDNVSIKFPQSVTLEEVISPASFGPGYWGHYKARLDIKNGGKTINYVRDFVFTPLTMEVEDYAEAKRIFDIVHEYDAHTLTLKKN